MAGCSCVLDGVGAASWAASLASLEKRGLMVSYGNASGPVPPLSPLELARGGSLFLTRPTLFDYVRSAEELQASAARLFGMIGSARCQCGSARASRSKTRPRPTERSRPGGPRDRPC